MRLSSRNFRASVKSFRLSASSVRPVNIGIRTSDNDGDSCGSVSSGKGKITNEENDNEDNFRLLALEQQLQEIEKRKQLDIQNIEDWKKEEQWKMEQMRFRAQLEYVQAEFEQKNQPEREVLIRSDGEIQQLLNTNKILRRKLSQLENERTEIMATNIGLLADYRDHDIMSKLLKKQAQIKFEKNQTLRISRQSVEKLMEEDEAEIQRLTEDWGCEMRQKEVYQNANTKIIDSLHSRCVNHNLVFDAVILKNKAGEIDKNVDVRARQLRTEDNHEIATQNESFCGDYKTFPATMPSSSYSIRYNEASEPNEEQTNSVMRLEVSCEQGMKNQVHKTKPGCSVFTSNEDREDFKTEERQNIGIKCPDTQEKIEVPRAKDIFPRYASSSPAPRSDCGKISGVEGDDCSIRKEQETDNSKADLDEVLKLYCWMIHPVLCDQSSSPDD